MKKLEIIIEELEDQVYVLQQKLDKCFQHGPSITYLYYGQSHTPDYESAHQLAQALGAAKRELKFYKSLDGNRVQLRKLEHQLHSYERLLTQAKSYLPKYQDFLKRNLDSTPAHKSYLQSKIEGFKNQITTYDAKIKDIIEKMEEAQSVQKSTNEKDLLYELTTLLYNGELEQIEIRIPIRHGYTDLSLHIKNDQEKIMILFLNIKSHTYEHKFSSEQKRRMRAIGYEDRGGTWTVEVHKRIMELNDLVLIISRTLFEVLRIGGHEIELRY